MRNSNSPTGYNCDVHLHGWQAVPATTHVEVWGGIWNGEVSDLCEEHLAVVHQNESVYTKVRYTKIEENTNA
ncbi:hypothetical protein OV320_7846 [Actinobacteria bacterium OV320]|jgi:hypothetical protein|nr:hypothetical protein OV320_7846 [Actinobacteria bacterium OV320]